uniref:restriction endonuclease subunit S n=1 Tax=Segatella copri TaxID=165179 RepID=UPI003FEFBC3A
METYKLSDLCEILDAKRKPLSALQRAKKQGIYPYYGAQGIIDHLDEYLLDGEYLLVAEDGANLETRNQPIANIAKGKIWVNNHAHVLGSNGKCPLNLLGFILNNMNISPYVTGCAQPKLNQENLRNIEIELPSHIDSIASILSSLDRKIELNNKINADLEEMAQAIFKNWFVDFEPFKDGKFVDSELGMIPEGWKVVVFDNILKVTTTKTGKEGIPEYSVTNTGIHPRDEKFTKNLSKSSAKNKLIRKGNLVFGMSREILNWGIMKEEVGGVSSAYNVYIVDEKIVNTTYLECFIAQRMDYFADLIKPASREGQGVDKALLMKKIICIPPSEVMDVFLEKYNSIKLLTEIRNQESSRLSLLRDTLLPRLMSGELEVPE